MNYTSQVYFSNRVEELFLRLKEVLYAPPSTAFTRRLLIVPSPAIKSWLMLKLAQDEDLGIAAGLEIAYLDQSIQELRQLFGSTEAQHIPTPLELALAIEWTLRNHLKRQEPDPVWDPLISYLQIHPDQRWSTKSEKRLIALSETVAHLFLHYGKYGGEVVNTWENSEHQEWQQALWNLLFSKQDNGWSYLFRELNTSLDVKVEHRDLNLHLFSISFIPGVQHRFLQRLSSLIPVHYYLLSPCQAFWSDIHSDGETRRLRDYWQQRGVSQTQQMELEAYLKDRNPLLANFGRMGREMSKLIEESFSVTSEQYWLPSSLQDNTLYSSWLSSDVAFWKSNHTLTVLQAIQADMLLLRNPAKEKKKNLFSEDDLSVQIHAAPTRLREVEVLHDVLLRIIDTHSSDTSPITPSDILVMAPDILQYEPLIRMIFETPNSALKAQIMDLRMLSQDSFVQAFLHLLNLPKSRWDANRVLELFHFPAFQRQQQWSTEDLNQIEKWINASGINWGLDSQHRNEILQREHCPKMLDDTPAGTWEFGFSRLLMGLAMQMTDHLSLPIIPLEGVESIRGELLGHFIHLIRSLRQDLKVLGDGSQLTLQEWSRYLKNLYKTYFWIDKEEDDTRFLQLLESFGRSCGLPQTAQFGFTSIYKHLELGLSAQTTIYREAQLQTVKFCTLLPMRTMPAKVVVLIGMDEGAYPKRDQTLSLNLMKGHPKADYAPSQTDFDRYLFLEALLSARHYFLITYSIRDEEDFKEQSPSLLVSELLNYVDKSYGFGEKCCWNHPLNAFDKMYFEPHSRYRSFSGWQYRNACAYYHVEKAPTHRVVPSFLPLPQLEQQEPIMIELKDLIAFGQNPLKSYFNKSLGLYVEKPKKQIEVDEKLQLNPLDLDGFKKRALQKGLEATLHLAEKTGQLPYGVFKELGRDVISEEFEQLQECFSQEGIDPSHLFDVQLSLQCQNPQRVDNKHWIVPALKLLVAGCEVTIVGKFASVSSKGMFVHYKYNEKDLVKAWPQCLIYQCLLEAQKLPWEPKVIFLKTGKSLEMTFPQPLELLKNYVEYYLKGLKQASPLIPEWVPLILKHEESELEKKLEDSLNDPFAPLYNEYVHWSLPDSASPNAKEIIKHWKPLAETLYGPVLNSKKRAKR